MSGEHEATARALLSRATYAGEVNEAHVEEFAEALAAEHARGALEMRARAAAVAERAHDADDGDSACRAGRTIARLIRDLEAPAASEVPT